jgi:hypothetical protein
MNGFPLTLRRGDDTLSLDPNRIAFVQLGPELSLAAATLISSFDLDLDSSILPTGMKSLGRVCWLRHRSESPIETALLAALSEAFADVAHWLLPVYCDATGTEFPVAPLPHVLVAETAGALDSDREEQLAALFEGFGYLEATHVSACLGGPRCYLRASGDTAPAWDVVEELHDLGSNYLRDVRLEFYMPDVEFAGPSHYEPDALNPLDERYLRLARVLEAQQSLGPAYDTPIIVAVIDSGVDLTHPDIELLSNGLNVDPVSLWAPTDGSPTGRMIASPGSQTYDKFVLNSHGTAIAGIIAMKPDNARGGWGVTPGARILPIAMTEGPATDISLAYAIGYAIASGARVINMSLKMSPLTKPQHYPGFYRQLEVARERGCVVCAAAGNRHPLETYGSVQFPAIHPDVIACTAIDNASPTLERWHRACVGPEISVAAPSRRVSTTSIVNSPDEPEVSQGGYTTFDEGMTSFATAVVSGIAALLLKKYPTLAPDRVRAVLERTANKVGPILYTEEREHGTHNYQLGFGAVDAFRALNFADVFIRRDEHAPPEADVNDTCEIVVSAIDFADPESAFSFPPNAFSGSVVPGVTNYVYVRVTNDGPATALYVECRLRLVDQALSPFTLADFRSIDGSHTSLPASGASLHKVMHAGESVVFKYIMSPAVTDIILAGVFGYTKYSLLAEARAVNDYVYETANLSGNGLERRWTNLARRNLTMAPLFLEREPTFTEFAEGAAGTPVAITRLHAFRALDMLDLDIELRNLVAEPAGRPTRFVRRNRNQPSHVIVHFAPQNIAEAATFEGPGKADAFVPAGQPAPMPPLGTPQSPPQPPIPRRIAGRSRLAFKLPDGMDELPCKLDALLDWLVLEPSISSRAVSVDAAAQNRPTDDVTEPAETETALEIPHRLVLSTNERSTWVHATTPVTRAERTELWHTRLAVRADGVADENAVRDRTVRAIWSPDYQPGEGPDPKKIDPFRATLSPNDRHQIVRLTSDYGIASPIVISSVIGSPLIIDESYDPMPIDVDRLMLSSLGAWAELRGSWDMRNFLREREDLSIEEWQHVATLGRDHFARVVYAGFIWPTCHRASLVKTTERKVQTVNGSPVAVLRQRFSVLIRQPERGYAASAYEFAGRENPFLKSIRIHDVMITDVALPAPLTGTHSFWIADGADPLRFACTGVDVEGRPVDFQMGALFVPINDLPEKVEEIAQGYAASPAHWRMSRVGGRKMAFAHRSGTATSDGTTLETDGLELRAVRARGNDETTRFVPLLEEAEVRLPIVEQLVGNASGMRIRIADAYLRSLPNAAAIFAELVTPPKLEVPAEKAGALATPNLLIGGISDRLGPLGGDTAALAAGTFNPLGFFDTSAKLLGAVRLGEIVEPLFDDKQFPAMRTDVVTEGGARYTVSSLTFTPQVREFGPFVMRAGGSKLEVRNEVKRALETAAKAVNSAHGKLTNFSLNLVDVIRVDFDRLEFKRIGDGPLEISADLPANAVRFGGPLEFVNALRDFIPSDVFGSGLSIDVQPKGVTAGYTLALPPIEIGVLAIKNASLSAALFLPFHQDQARLRFCFCERHRPFQLVVTLFGGGGFFALGVGMDGIETVEAALEFGGAFSLNLGVASGSVEAMAGIYFKWEVKDGKEFVLITGYLRMGGAVQVLGIVTISITFYLALSWQDEKVRGQAALTVKVEVLMFSASVTLSVEHSFSGSAGDPPFGELVDEGDWLAYANAFD